LPGPRKKRRYRRTVVIAKVVIGELYCIKKAEKIGRANDEKGGKQAEKARRTIENEKQKTHFSLLYYSLHL